MDQRKSKSTGYGMFTGIFWVIALGIVLGILIGFPIRGNDGWQGSPSELAALLAAGIGLAYILLSALDWFTQWRALTANPLPEGLDLSERAVASEQLGALKGGTLLHRHIRRLLAAWSAGASGPQVASMANSQMQRMMGVLGAETVGVLVLLASVAGFSAPQILLTLSSGFMILLVLIAIARFQLAIHLAGYIESNLLARIGNDTPAAAGLEFAQTVGKTVAESTDALAKAQDKVAEQLAKVQAESSDKVAKAQTDAAAQMTQAQSEASSAIAKAQDKVAEQLGRVSELAASIEGIFKLQQAVDGAIKGVAVSDEFKSTLVDLKKHLAASDELLKNAAKPRTIRLVEKDND